MLKFSPTVLARQTGYSVGHMSRVLRGERSPSVRCLKALARVTGFTTDQLIANVSHGGRGSDRHGKKEVWGRG